MTSDFDLARRKRVRRTALLFGGIAVAFYVGFIAMSVLRAERGGRHVTPTVAAAAAR